MNSRSFVIPEDIKKIAKSILSHRLVLNYEAVVDEVSNDDLVKEILSSVKVV
jgi:MoxR-like ATPase